MDKEKKKFGVFKYILILAVLVILGNSLVICREDEYSILRYCFVDCCHNYSFVLV